MQCQSTPAEAWGGERLLGARLFADPDGSFRTRRIVAMASGPTASASPFNLLLSVGVGVVALNWNDIPGWFQWRSAQEEAAQHFPEGSRFVEVGNFLGRSLCSLGEVATLSGKRFTLIGVDTCRGSGVEGPRGKDYHGTAVAEAGGTLAGVLHKNIIDCGHGDAISLIVADSVIASTFFADRIDRLGAPGRTSRSRARARRISPRGCRKSRSAAGCRATTTTRSSGRTSCVRSESCCRRRALVDEPVAVGAAMRAADSKTVCFCTLAIHAPYRRRARLLCADARPRRGSS